MKKPAKAVCGNSIKKTIRTNLTARRNRMGYIYVLPLVLGIVFIFLPAFCETIRFSFSDMQITENGYKLNDVGLRHYHKLLTSDTWYITASFSVFRSIIFQLITVLIFSFFVAILLNQKFAGRSIARTVFFLPVILNTGIVAVLQNADLLTTNAQLTKVIDLGTLSRGPGLDIETFLMNSTLDIRVVNFLVNSSHQLYGMVTSSGVQILLFLSGLHSISPQLYEAAQVEGCTSWESFWKITLPMVSPLLLVNGIYTLIDSSMGPNNDIVRQVLYQISGGEYSYSSAMVMVYLVLVLLLMGIVFIPMHKLVFYQN